jgi:hypothetical protein
MGGGGSLSPAMVHGRLRGFDERHRRGPGTGRLVANAPQPHSRDQGLQWPPGWMVP